MSDYKNTLNLPQTDFPMKANLSQREVETLNKWQQMGIYAKLREQNKGKKKFILHDGPPYANGHIHVGHAVNKILKDMVVKSKSMSGFESPFVPGWDCHGLPIELNVEKKHGKPGHKISAAAFREACREYAESQVDIQRSEFIRLGVIGDWENPYLTMSFHYEADVIRSLGKIIKNGHLQKGYKPVHWCLDCASALAEAEVEYKDKESPAIYVRFEVVDVGDFLKRFSTPIKNTNRISIPIWTTTPWTLPANEAVALNPGLDYWLVDVNDEQLLIAADMGLTANVLAACFGFDKEQLQQLNQCEDRKIRGELLQGVKLKHPFYDKQVPVVLGEHVTLETGTGAVHTAPAHGVDDFNIGKQYHLPLDNPVGDDGCFTPNTPLFAGVHVRKADEKVIEELNKHHSLIHQGKINHSYPHCWRHKTALIFRATPQWFISMDLAGLRKQSLNAILRVEWVPDWGQSRISGMIENRPDWCISRQRAWGVPLALFIHKQTGEAHPDTVNLIEKVADLVEKEGIEAWYTLDEKTLLGAEAEHYRKSMDVRDVWYDSGVSHECVLKQRPELAFPADIMLEGTDQHRGWFQSSLLTSMAMNGTESYKEILTHGFVVDAEGYKMSKSIGNVIAPEEVVKSLGADILRLWVASVDYRTEITASKEILNRISETYRRIRNTARFLLANLHGFDPETHLVRPEDMLMLDRFAVDKARQVQEEIIDAYESYQFHLIVQKLHHFCVVDLGGFYLDVIKDRQYTMQTNSVGRRSAQTALYHIVQALVRWMAPILSFTAEEVWQYIPGKKAESVQLVEWYEHLAAIPDYEMMNQAYWEKIRAVRDAVNKEIENMRNLGKLGSALEAEVTLYCGAQLKKQLDALENELRFVLITSSATVISEHAGPVDTVVTEVPGLSLKIEATAYPKCERCWHRREDVNANSKYPGLCGRCVENVGASGEERNYA